MAELKNLFTSNAVVQILDFLTLYDGFSYTKSEIIKNTGISSRTLYEVWPILNKFNLVKETRRVGRIALYTLNTENPISHKLDELGKEVAIYAGKKIADEQLKKPSYHTK